MKITKNLRLDIIEENNVQDGKLIAVACYFTFYNEDGVAYIYTDRLDREYPGYVMTEISSEVSDSFNSALEDEDNWKKIANKAKEFVKEWELNNAD